MTVSFGFYDSLNGDRVYNAEQFSSMFDGIVADGIFSSVGSAFGVTEDTNMDILVGIGRAWFNRTWTANDAPLSLTVTTADPIFDRIDTVIIEVNADPTSRTNAIKIVAGSPASTPVAPTLTDSGTLHQYPLADIYVGAAVTSISAANITNRVGVDVPFCTGILEVISINWAFNQWEAEFSAWFQNLQDELDANQAANLQNQIDAINALISGGGVGLLSGFQGLGDNYVITPTVVTNSLSVAIKTIAGNNPSSSDEVNIRIGDTKHSLQNSLSLTLSFGTNFFNAGGLEHATLPVEYIVYLGYRVSDTSIFLGVSRKFGKTYADFSATATSDKYLAYTGAAPASTDVLEVIGSFKAINSGTAAYNWSLSGTGDVKNRPINSTDPAMYEPQLTGDPSQLTISSWTVNPAWYVLHRSGLCQTYGRCQQVTTGGTAHTDINVSYPISADANYTSIPGAGQYVDGGLQTLAQIFMDSTTSFRVRKDTGGNWSNASSTIQVLWELTYKVV